MLFREFLQRVEVLSVPDFMMVGVSLVEVLVYHVLDVCIGLLRSFIET
jgi:hypothetical protein